MFALIYQNVFIHTHYDDIIFQCTHQYIHIIYWFSRPASIVYIEVSLFGITSVSDGWEIEFSEALLIHTWGGAGITDCHKTLLASLELWMKPSVNKD